MLSADVTGKNERGARPAGTPFEVLLTFLKLGLISFGGPVAHLGYFRTEFVERRRWLSEQAYAELVGLCQFLPGPASSQAGFALGLLRAGPWGGLAAWAGFTLPSAALMVMFAAWAGTLSESPVGAGLLHGLKLVAVSVVAQAVWSMARSLCPDRPRAAIALLATAVATFAPISVGQLGAIVLGALAGLALCSDTATPTAQEPMAPVAPAWVGAACLAAFAALLVLSLLPLRGGRFAVFGAFFRSGALVFGGGHVVLPLLHDAVVAPGWVTDDAFLAGYGAAQAMPGPLFTFAAFLGAAMHPGAGGAAGAIVPVLAIFLPGLLLLVGALSFWKRWRTYPVMRAVMRGTNAAVVGLLGAGFYDPVWRGAVQRPSDFVVALAGFMLLTIWRVPPLAVVSAGAFAGMGAVLLG